MEEGSNAYKDSPLTYREFREYMDENIVSRRECKANHRFLSPVKFWTAVGTIIAVQILQFARLA